MVLDRELDDGVGPVVEEALDALEASLGIPANPIGDLEVLALDDRPHGRPPRSLWYEARRRAGPGNEARARRVPSWSMGPSRLRV